MSNRRRAKRPRRPPVVPGWPTAAADQADATDLAHQGAELAVGVQVDIAAVAFTEPPEQHHEPLGRRAITGHLQAQLLTAGRTGQMASCVHLEERGDGPGFWLPHIPHAYLCDQCLTTAPRPLECSHCGVRAPLVLQRWVVYAGPVTIVAFLCPRCVATTRPEAAR